MFTYYLNEIILVFLFLTSKINSHYFICGVLGLYFIMSVCNVFSKVAFSQIVRFAAMSTERKIGYGK